MKEGSAARPGAAPHAAWAPDEEDPEVEHNSSYDESPQPKLVRSKTGDFDSTLRIYDDFVAKITIRADSKGNKVYPSGDSVADVDESLRY